MTKKKRILTTLLAGFGSLVLILGISYMLLTRYQGFNIQDFLNKEQKIPQEEATNEEVALISDKSLPDGFPKDFPIYENSTLINSWKAPGNTTEGYSVVWESLDSFDVVTGFIKENLTLSGWEIVSQSKEDNSQIITFQKDNKSGFVGIVRGENAKTVISVTIGVEEK
jgi:hypothetical protein